MACYLLERLGHGEDSRRRFLPELEKNRVSERLGEAGSVPGRASGSQEGGGDGGALGWLGKGSRGTNFTVARVLLVGVRGSKRRRVGRWSGFIPEWSTHGGSTSPDGAGRQAGCVHARGAARAAAALDRGPVILIGSL